METGSRLLRKLRIESPHEPASSLLGIYPHLENIYLQRRTLPCVHCGVNRGGPDAGTPTVPFDRGLERGVHLCQGTLSAMREDEILPFATAGMALENHMLSQLSPMEKAENHVISLICGT